MFRPCYDHTLVAVTGFHSSFGDNHWRLNRIPSMPDDIAGWNKGTGMMSTVFGSTASEISELDRGTTGRRQKAEVELCFWEEDRPTEE